VITPVTVTYLEMSSPDALVGVHDAPAGVRVDPATDPGQAAHDCYRLVGAPWHWTDRLPLTPAEWQERIDEEQGEVWTARAGDALVGYFQLARRDDAVEIRYFGLVPEWIGRGVGGWLLTRAVERAWSLGPRRVVLNTCTLDHGSALPNYTKRGFAVVREELRQREFP
jgi:GNAT superfamily N-acetyltransferase